MDQVLNVTKVQEGVNKSSSLFNITKSDSDEPLSWYIDNSTITVRLPKKTYGVYLNLINSDCSKNFFTSMIVVPILTEILTDLKCKPDECNDTEFIDSLDLILGNIGLEISSLKNIECISKIPFKLIDKLLDNSLNDIENLIMKGDD